MSNIKLIIEGEFGEIRLARAAKRNALTLDMINEIIAYQNELVKTPVAGLLLTAEGPAFCAGHDFSDMAGASIEWLQIIFRQCARMMLGFQNLPFPVVAAVQGAAVGAGCQLALSSDLVVAGENSTFQTPGGKGAWFCTTPMLEVVRAVTPKRALEMLFTGEPIKSKDAKNWGMINKVVPDSELMAHACNLLSLACRGSRTSKMLGKKTFYVVRSMEHTAAYELATEVMATSGADSEAQEAMQQVVSKQRKSL
jgi:enoyl-CoA hydratase/carnithine racemase